MAGSSRDHERGAQLPDELSDILRSLSERQTSILYHALTNHHVRGYFLELLQNRVVEITENHARRAHCDEERDHGRTPILRKAMPKLRPPATTTVPLRPTTDVAPYRHPSSSVMWRSNVANYIVPPPPLPPPSSPPPEPNPVPNSSSSVKAFCAIASSTATIPDVVPRSILRRSSRSRSRSRSSSASHVS